MPPLRRADRLLLPVDSAALRLDAPAGLRVLADHLVKLEAEQREVVLRAVSNEASSEKICTPREIVEDIARSATEICWE